MSIRPASSSDPPSVATVRNGPRRSTSGLPLGRVWHAIARLETWTRVQGIDRVVRPGFALLLVAWLAVAGSSSAMLACASGSGQPVVAGAQSAAQPSSEQLTVEAWNPVWGRALAPVTVVAFLDFECPYCARGHETLLRLREEYGPEQLRVVFKHAPLPFHARAMPAALAAQAVFDAGGPEAFFEYERLLFEHSPSLGDADLREWADDVGVDPRRLRERLADPEVEAAVNADLDFAARVGVSGVPAFFVNGARLVGARPDAEFKVAIDHELVAANALRDRGTAAADVYAARVSVNLSAEVGVERSAADPTPYVVPVGNSPSKGAGDEAWVTIVEFADFECPFCQRAHATIKRLMQSYPGKIRWVMKHNPLAFHPLAVPAAVLALELRAQRGDAAYWAFLDELYQSPQLSQAQLEELAARFGLDAGRLAAARARGSNHPLLTADRDLAMDLQASGTPHFFVNGRRIAGAQPYEVFQQAVEEELTHVEQLLQSTRGVTNPYAALQSRAAPPPGLQRVEIGQPPSSSPRLGGGDAPVVIQMFSDFECGYCQRVMPTLAQLLAKYPGKVAVVWRHLPLGFHQHARRAAIAALEVQARRGQDAFWQMAAKLFDLSDSRQGPLTAQVIAGHAAAFGVPDQAIDDAIERRVHDAAIDRDVELAERLGISGTPTFVINGYRLVGAQPPERFERLIRLALGNQGSAASPTADLAVSAR